ncbi:Peroxiredoxin [Sparassis crispa]|uniref:thioredoxin-dependent peroxiredoxin n=1 Tax=Sparassis crispa TaxID=139825 RepID=A0A401GQ63_9APHY|nr:Peroxiredoxin [Sparassis crispa]GBE84363.1 Peroxiredoxin [Sparassis crispa]
MILADMIRRGVKPSCARHPGSVYYSLLRGSGRGVRRGVSLRVVTGTHLQSAVAHQSSAGSSEPTRRSTRISSQPKAEVNEPAKKVGEKSNKRTAEQHDDDSPVLKKNKAEEAATEASDAPEAAQALAHIDIGDSLPSLVLKNEKGEDVEVSTMASEKGVILFLVPKADTPGCTTQACGFRDIYPDFTSHNFDVYCLSADSPTAQTKWQTKKELPYDLLSDSKRVLISALGAGEGGKTKRSHFIFEKGGKLVDKKMPVKPADSPRLALEFVKGLNAE